MSVPQNAVDATEESLAVTASSQVNFMTKNLPSLDNLSDDARHEVTRHEAPVQAKHTGCHFLDKIPIELRDIIYSLVLVNPILGEPSSILEAANFGELTAYGLGPGLLATCKQIHSEASCILYAKNTFIMSFGVSDHRWVRRHNSSLGNSPVMRYATENAIAKVRKWKVFIGSNYFEAPCSPKDFLNFCRTICHSPPKSVELLIAEESLPGSCVRSLAEVLQPLRRLRNVETFTFREASINQLPWIIQLPGALSRKSFFMGQESFQREISELVTGSSPVEFSTDIHSCLIFYYTAFDRRKTLRKSKKLICALFAMEHHVEDTIRPWHYDSRELNPIHFDLKTSHEAAEGENATQVKQSRASILKYLEPRYQRLAAASINMAEFVKEQKQPDGLFTSDTKTCSDTYDWAHELSRGVVLLGDYVDAFEDHQESIKFRAFIKSRGNSSLQNYKGFLAEVAIEQINMMIDSAEYTSASDLFKTAVDSLDRQYLMVREARKGIYQFDSMKEYGSTIALNEPPPLCDEMVAWDVDEPVFGPIENPLGRSRSGS